MKDDRLLKLEQSRMDSSLLMSRLLKLEESKERRMNMILSAKNIDVVEIDVDAELVADILDGLSADEMAEVFNEEKILEKNDDTVWNYNMIESLNENGRKHIKRLYDMVCHWYECNEEDAEAEGYTEW